MRASMSCLCRFAALLSCVALAVISLAMWLSTEFVNNLVAALNVLASQVATALDTLNFALAADRNQESDPRMPPRAPRNSRHGLRPCIITERISSDRSAAPELGLWILLLPGIYLHYHLIVKHVVKLQEATLVNVQRLWWTGYRRQDLSLPTPHAMIVRGTLRLLRLIRVRTVQSVHIPVLHRSVHRRRWSMDLVNFYRNSLLPSAMNISNHSRHGHRVSWMRWSDAKGQGFQAHLQDYRPFPSETHRGSQAGMEGLPAT